MHLMGRLLSALPPLSGVSGKQKVIDCLPTAENTGPSKKPWNASLPSGCKASQEDGCRNMLSFAIRGHFSNLSCIYGDRQTDRPQLIPKHAAKVLDWQLLAVQRLSQRVPLSGWSCRRVELGFSVCQAAPRPAPLPVKCASFLLENSTPQDQRALQKKQSSLFPGDTDSSAFSAPFWSQTLESPAPLPSALSLKVA